MSTETATPETTRTPSAETILRAEVMKKFGRHERDGGSPEVQIALLTQKLEQLGTHFKSHPQDVHSQRGMQRMINQRKKLLAYLRTANLGSYKTVIAELGIRK